MVSLEFELLHVFLSFIFLFSSWGGWVQSEFLMFGDGQSYRVAHDSFLVIDIGSLRDMKSKIEEEMKDIRGEKRCFLVTVDWLR